MISLKNVLVGAAAVGMVTLFSGASFAQGTQAPVKAHHEAKMKLLQDSAAALQQTNPDLANKLNDLVKEEAAELAILETYLPKLMSRDDVEKVAKVKKTKAKKAPAATPAPAAAAN